MFAVSPAHSADMQQPVSGVVFPSVCCKCVWKLLGPITEQNRVRREFQAEIEEKAGGVSESHAARGERCLHTGTGKPQALW